MAIVKKFIGITVLLVIIFALLPGKPCLGSNGQLSAKKKTAELAAKILIDKLQEKAKEKEIDLSYLSKKMNDNPAGYQRKEIGWTRLQKEETENFQERYEKEVEAILKGLNRDKPEKMDDYFTKQQREVFRKCPEKVVENYLTKNFGKSPADETTVFSDARKKACEEQWQRTTLDVYPTETEVDTMAREQLRSKLLDQLLKKQREVLFSENQSLMAENFIDPILNDAESQLKKQKDILNKSDGGNQVTSEGINKYLNDEIDSYQNRLGVEKAGKKIANKVYKVFPSVAKQIPTRTNELVVKKFCDALDGMEIKGNRDDMKSLMEGNITLHSNKGKSWELCLERFRKGILAKAIGDYATKAPQEKQSVFLVFLGELISSNKNSQAALDRLVNRSLKQDFDQVRQEISKKQFEKFFGPLAKGSWKPPVEEIDNRYNTLSVEVSDPLKMKDISSESFDPASLLEETLGLVSEAEKAVINKGLMALRSQMGIVEQLQSQVKSELEKMSTPTIDDLVKLYNEKVKLSWSSSELAKEYSNLFERTNDEIRRRAKDMVKIEAGRREKIEIEQEKQQQIAVPEKKAPSSKPSIGIGSGDKGDKGGGSSGGDKPGVGGGQGGGVGGDTGGGGGGKDQLYDLQPVDAIIDLDYERGAIAATIMFPKKTPVSFRFNFGSDGQISPEILKNSMTQVQKLFEAWLLGVATEKSKGRNQKINLYVVARVFDGRVYYGIVFNFRKCLEDALNTVEGKNLEVNWYDGLFEKIEKEKPRIELEIRMKTRSLRNQRKI